MRWAKGEIKYGLPRLFLEQEVHHLNSSLGNGSTRTEDGSYASLVEEVVVLSGNHTTGNDHDIIAAQLVEFLDELRDERLVTPISTSKPQSA